MTRMGILGGMSGGVAAVYYRLAKRRKVADAAGLQSEDSSWVGDFVDHRGRCSAPDRWEEAGAVLAAESSARVDGAPSLLLARQRNTMHKVAEAIIEAIDVRSSPRRRAEGRGSCAGPDVELATRHGHTRVRAGLKSPGAARERNG